MTEPSDPAERAFSVSWTVLSVVLFLAVELGIGAFLGPLIVGKYVSPMFHLEVQMLMHLLAFWLGGIGVGLLSPGRRLLEPAVGAFVSVLSVFLMSFFLPNLFMAFSWNRVMVAGGLGFFLALLGAWQAEGWMGNLDPDDEKAKQTARGRLRSSLWAEDEGLLAPKHRDRTR